MLVTERKPSCSLHRPQKRSGDPLLFSGTLEFKSTAQQATCKHVSLLLALVCTACFSLFYIVKRTFVFQNPRLTHYTPGSYEHDKEKVKGIEKLSASSSLFR